MIAEDGQSIGSLLDAAPCGFLSFSDDGGIRLLNATLLGMLGYTRDELVAKHVEAILVVGSRIFYQTHLFPLLRLHGHADEIFLLLRAKNGEGVAVLTNAVRRERDGEWITDLVMMRLVERRKFEDALLDAKRMAEEATIESNSRRRELESANELLERQAIELEMTQEQLISQATELERQRGIAEEANRAKSAFLAMMSHELRTPLNAIGGYVQLMELGVHGPVNDAQMEALGRVTRSQQHLLRLINDLLNLARIEAGHVDYDLQSISLDDVVHATLPMIEPQLAARALRYDVDVPRELRVQADREKVEQILLNLLSNASKFTPQGGSVSVEAAVSAEFEDVVELRVRDTGIGIPEGKIAQIFEPFVQVESSKSARVEGSGLGLSISRDLARGMGGDIVAESAVGIGSTFELRLPRG